MFQLWSSFARLALLDVTGVKHFNSILATNSTVRAVDGTGHRPGHSKQGTNTGASAPAHEWHTSNSAILADEGHRTPLDKNRAVGVLHFHRPSSPAQLRPTIDRFAQAAREWTAAELVSLRSLSRAAADCTICWCMCTLPTRVDS